PLSFAISPDGRRLVFLASNEGKSQLWVRPLESLAARPLAGTDGAIYPFLNRDDTRSMCGHFRDNLLQARPIAAPGGQWQVSTAGGITPRWGPGGKELYYIAPDGTLMAAPIAVTGATIEPGRPAALFRTRIYGGGTDVNV